jgi:GAF domain-containing protein
MEPHANLDRTPPASGAKPMVGVALQGALHPQPGVDNGRSLAEMAQRDLDAALQLLADRAQYITGASGAAIALRRDGKKDMLCRASSGANAPELGALLSTEFGLSGESVRTRQPLRCDDAERDARVNRDVCRQMGIASVVVMPVVNDDEVLGVFELFSGKANAFGARDLSAVQRLSEMVETAVRLAHATETLPERLKMQETSAPESKETTPVDAQTLDGQVPEVQATKAHALDGQILAGELLADIIVEDSDLEDSILEDPAAEIAIVSAEHSGADVSSVEALADQKSSIAAPESVKTETPVALQASREESAAAAPIVETAPKKKLFWSAALNPAADAGTVVEPDQSHVPPMLRSLRKCEACGFPVSAGRMLCVECEEKKWRGQLRVSRSSPPRQAAMPNVAAEKLGASGKPSVAPAASVPAALNPEARAFAAAAQTAAAGASAPSTTRATAAVPTSSGTVAVPPAARQAERQPISSATASSAAARESGSAATAQTSSSQPSRAAAPEFVLSAGLESPQSWLATHKYILGVLLVVGGAVAAVFLLR